MHEAEDKEAEVPIRVPYRPSAGCVSTLVGMLIGGLLILLSVPLFVWWMQNGFRSDEIPDNKIGVVICAYSFGALCLTGGAFLGFRHQRRK